MHQRVVTILGYGHSERSALKFTRLNVVVPDMGQSRKERVLAEVDQLDVCCERGIGSF